MNFFQRRGVALVISALVILGSVSYGATSSLQRAIDRVEEGFYDGVEYDGYLHKSIASQLQARLDNANGIFSLTSAVCPEETEAAREVRSNMYSALQYGSSPSSLYYYNEELTTAMTALDQAVAAAELPEDEREAYEKYYSDFNAAMDVIAESGYNESCREFQQEVLSQFTAEFIYYNSSVYGPSVFA